MLQDLQINGGGGTEGSGGSEGSGGNLTKLKFQHDSQGVVTMGTIRASKVDDVVTLNIPTFKVTTDVNTNNIVENLITGRKPFTPLGTTNK